MQEGYKCPFIFLWFAISFSFLYSQQTQLVNSHRYKKKQTISLASPTIQPFAFTKVPMNAGEFANLQCIVPIGDLPLKIRWTYPGEKLGGASGVLIKKVADRVSMLMITAITEKQAGAYICTAENAAGAASYAANLTVNGSQLFHSRRMIEYIVPLSLFCLLFRIYCVERLYDIALVVYDGSNRVHRIGYASVSYVHPIHYDSSFRPRYNLQRDNSASILFPHFSFFT